MTFLEEQKNKKGYEDDIIVSFLSKGRENAITKKDLMNLTGYSDRVLRQRVEDLRKEVPILSNTKEGGYYLPDDGQKGIDECNEFIFEQQARANNIYVSLTAVMNHVNQDITEKDTLIS